MFTGIVQAMGTVESIRPGATSARLSIDAPDLMRPIDVGASVCVSGVCLTVIQCDDSTLAFDVIPETMSCSTLGALDVGDRVNLERSLRAGDPMDGHCVQGHIDGTAIVREIQTGSAGRPGYDEGHVVTFNADEAVIPYLIQKGSVTVDGVSLTIADVAKDEFFVALIPTTLNVTTLGTLHVGSIVNIESDIMARTIVRTLQRWQTPSSPRPLTVALLHESGW